MPTLKAIHICNSHQPKRKPKIAKEYVFANADKNTCKRMKIKTKEEHRTHNSTYTQVGVQCFYESEVLNPSSVLLLKFRAKNPHLRVAAKRYGQAEKTHTDSVLQTENKIVNLQERKKI